VHLRAMGQNSIDAQYDTNVDSNGRFEIAGVVPGDYLISVIEPGSMTARWMPTTRSLTVDDNVLDLELRARLGARINGHVVRDAFATRSLDATGVSVTFEYRISGDGAAGIGWGGIIARGANGAMRIGSDGAFSIESPGGMSVIRVSEVPANWTVKAVRMDDADITDLEVDFGEGVRQVEIVLTDRVSQLRGSVVERTGRPLAGASVIVFADNSPLWAESSRRVREIRSGRDGQFQITGLPPGDYFGVAVENIPAGAWRNPDVLNRLRPLATQFHLDEGEERVVILRPSPAPDELIP
jgi:Carboxypeptidase regulatory-like domain/Polysaccharide lyase family 4, domain II